MAGGGRNRQQQNYWNTQAQQQNQQMTQQSPEEALRRQQVQQYLAWKNQDGRDVRDAPGLSDYIQIGEAAKERAGRERMGTGALKLGGEGGFAEKLRQQKQAEAAQDFGIGLERAYAMNDAQMTGSVLPFASLDANRRQAQAGHSASMFSQWNQRRSRNWWDYMMDVGQLATGAARAMSGGMGG